MSTHLEQGRLFSGVREIHLLRKTEKPYAWVFIFIFWSGLFHMQKNDNKFKK